jgi:fructose-specific phosphotransferase system component IIB
VDKASAREIGPILAKHIDKATTLQTDEAKLYIQGSVESLGADCIEKKMTPEHVAKLERLLARAGIKADAKRFRRYGSARKLYNFHTDHADAY